MSSLVQVPIVGGELRAIKYQPGYVRRYGPEDRYEMTVPARIGFYLGEAWVALEIEDARDLLEALPGLLAQHEYAEFVTGAPEPKAAA
jgi:hypothetical protein